MASEREQDRWLRRLLRRRAASPSAPAAPGSCLDAGTLAAWADGALNAGELATAEIHVSNCPRCTALLAALERTTPAAPEAGSRGLLVRWLVPVAAAAAAIAIWVAIPEQQVTPVAKEAASRLPPVTAPAASAPLETPPPAPQAQAAPRQAPGTSADELAARGARNEAQEAREERALEADARPGERRAAAAPAPPAAPAPQAAAAEALADSPGRMALNKAAVVEAITPDPLVRWRVLAGTEVERSTDGGKTWTRAWPQREASPSTSPAITIVAIHAVDALSATITTSDGRTLSTTDGGTAWVPVQGNPAAPF